LPAISKLDPSSTQPPGELFACRMMNLIQIAIRTLLLSGLKRTDRSFGKLKEDTMKAEHASSFSIELQSHLLTHVTCLVSYTAFPRIHTAMRRLWASTKFPEEKLFPLLFGQLSTYGREVACVSLCR